jgi:hypothetical protein
MKQIITGDLFHHIVMYIRILQIIDTSATLKHAILLGALQ